MNEAALLTSFRFAANRCDKESHVDATIARSQTFGERQIELSAQSWIRRKEGDLPPSELALEHGAEA